MGFSGPRGHSALGNPHVGSREPSSLAPGALLPFLHCPLCPVPPLGLLPQSPERSCVYLGPACTCLLPWSQPPVLGVYRGGTLPCRAGAGVPAWSWTGQAGLRPFVVTSRALSPWVEGGRAERLGLSEFHGGGFFLQEPPPHWSEWDLGLDSTAHPWVCTDAHTHACPWLTSPVAPSAVWLGPLGSRVAGLQARGWAASRPPVLFLTAAWVGPRYCCSWGSAVLPRYPENASLPPAHLARPALPAWVPPRPHPLPQILGPAVPPTHCPAAGTSGPQSLTSAVALVWVTGQVWLWGPQLSSPCGRDRRPTFRGAVRGRWGDAMSETRGVRCPSRSGSHVPLLPSSLGCPASGSQKGSQDK